MEPEKDISSWTIGKESLIPYNLTQRAPETHKEHQKHKNFSTVTPNVTLKQIKQMQNTAQFFKLKIFLYTNINNKNTSKTV